MPGRIEHRVRIVTNLGGGFSLSEAAAREIARRKGLTLRGELGHLFVGTEGHERLEAFLPRDDADLIAVVEEMGAAAASGGCRLHVGDYVLVAEVQADGSGRETVVGWLSDG